jgi:hypothetical protein
MYQAQTILLRKGKHCMNPVMNFFDLVKNALPRKTLHNLGRVVDPSKHQASKPGYKHKKVAKGIRKTKVSFMTNNERLIFNREQRLKKSEKKEKK